MSWYTLDMHLDFDMLWYVHMEHVISLVEMVILCYNVHVSEAMVGTLTLIWV